MPGNICANVVSILLFRVVWEGGGRIRFRQQLLFWFSFFSGQKDVLQQGRTLGVHRVEHTTAFPAARPGRKGTHKGSSYGDRARRRGRVDMRADPFPSTTLWMHLWQRPDPREPGTAHPGLCFSRLRGRLGSQRRTGRVGVVSNFCSDSVFSLVRGVFCNRVEHTTAFPAARLGCKGTHKGSPYGDRAGHTSGPIRFRQQLLFWLSFFSGEEGVLQQGRTLGVHRVEHTTAFPAARPGRKGTHKGRPYSTVRFAIG